MRDRYFDDRKCPQLVLVSPIASLVEAGHRSPSDGTKKRKKGRKK